MKKPCAVLAVILAMVSSVAVAAADPRFNGRGGATRSGVGRPTHSAGSSLRGHGAFGHRGFGAHRHFVPVGVPIAPPVVVYSVPPLCSAPPPSYYGSVVSSTSVIVPPPMYSSPAYGAPAPMPPAPRIVEYPTGRYELRGDGVGTPYNWIWIPNPPPPPAPPTAAVTSPASRPQVYRWVDEQGVIHWTNQSDTIPRQYRQSS
jgi:hypothetical protein